MAPSPWLAGTWQPAYTWVGTITLTNSVGGPGAVDWLPDGSNASGSIAGINPSANTNGTIATTLNWQPSGPGDDPVPGPIYAKVVSSAAWTGNPLYSQPQTWTVTGAASNGLGSPYVETADANGHMSGGQSRGVKTLRFDIVAGQT